MITWLPVPFAPEAASGIPNFFSPTNPVLQGQHVLLLPLPTPAETEPMRWQAAAHLSFDMVGGYFIGPAADGHAFVGGPGLAPTAQLFSDEDSSSRAPSVTPDIKVQFLADLDSWKVTRIVLGPAANSPLIEQTVSALVGAAPKVDGDVEVWDVRTKSWAKTIEGPDVSESSSSAVLCSR